MRSPSTITDGLSAPEHVLDCPQRPSGHMVVVDHQLIQQHREEYDTPRLDESPDWERVYPEDVFELLYQGLYGLHSPRVDQLPELRFVEEHELDPLGRGARIPLYRADKVESSLPRELIQVLVVVSLVRSDIPHSPQR